jgi:Predicted enzyme related to lactoylglutathione lyase
LGKGDNAMRYCWTTIHVKNMDNSLRFYQEVVGLTIDRRFSSTPGMDIVFLGNGDTKIELIYNQEETELTYGRDISLGFEVASIEESMEAIVKKGYSIFSGPFQPNPHVKFFYVLDPNGLKIQFVENC